MWFKIIILVFKNYERPAKSLELQSSLFLWTYFCNSTRSPVSYGNSRAPVTNKCAKYNLQPDASEELEMILDNEISDILLPLVWVDTVGWDDSDLQGTI